MTKTESASYRKEKTTEQENAGKHANSDALMQTDDSTSRWKLYHAQNNLAISPTETTHMLCDAKYGRRSRKITIPLATHS
jgi:hypothetical protein